MSPGSSHMRIVPFEARTGAALRYSFILAVRLTAMRCQQSQALKRTAAAGQPRSRLHAGSQVPDMARRARWESIQAARRQASGSGRTVEALSAIGQHCCSSAEVPLQGQTGSCGAVQAVCADTPASGHRGRLDVLLLRHHVLRHIQAPVQGCCQRYTGEHLWCLCAASRSAS